MNRLTLFTLLAAVMVFAGCDASTQTAAPESDPQAVNLSAAPAASKSATPSDEYVILFKGNKLPKNFDADIAAAGGSVIFKHETGFAFVDGTQRGGRRRAPRTRRRQRVHSRCLN